MLIRILLLLTLTLSLTARPHPVHTDGIEPYSPPKSHQAYVSQLPEEERQALYAREGDMDWWKEARFGFFVHWGPSSMLPCSMSWGRKGPRPHHPTNGSVSKGIPQDIYDNQYKKFKAEGFDADAWIQLVKASGAKYFIFTAKHHDGFCMFDTKLTDYNIMNTPFGRDALKELVDACHKYGIKVGIYYSQPDWNNKIYASDDKGKYCDEYLHPQIRELMTNYGNIDIIWFDGLGLHPDTWKAPKLLKMIRELQPGIISNHRFGHPPMHMGDFDGPERSIGRFQINRPWETCTVIGGGWAWMGDAPAMPLPQAISLLVRCAGSGGNLALGVGPTGAGVYLSDHEKRLRQMGAWLKKYGESVYGTQGGPYMPGTWGTATHQGNTVYLHVLTKWQGELHLPALPAKILSAEVLTGGSVVFTQNSEGLFIKMKEGEIDPINTLIKLTLDRPASEITPIKTQDLPLSIGAQATASSEKSAKHAASSVVAANMKDFSEGIFVKSSWSPERNDKKPWIQLKLNQVESVQSILIREGKFGSPSKVQSFTIEAKIDGQWKTINEGIQLGGDCNILLTEPVVSDTFRLRITQFKGGLNLNSFELYK